MERVRIELLQSGGASVRAIAKKYGLNHYSVHRHWHHHVSEERKANLMLGPVQRQALAARVAEESESVLDHLKSVRAGLYQLYEAALSAGDPVGGAMLAGRLHENLNSMARLTGQLASSPLVQNTTNVFLLPQFAEVQAVLVRVLAAHPAARADVIRSFREMEARMASPAAPINSRVLIEQDAHAA